MFHLTEGSWETVCEVSANNVRKSEEQTPEPWRCDVLIMLTFDSMPFPLPPLPTGVKYLPVWQTELEFLSVLELWNFI